MIMIKLSICYPIPRCHFPVLTSGGALIYKYLIILTYYDNNLFLKLSYFFGKTMYLIHPVSSLLNAFYTIKERCLLFVWTQSRNERCLQNRKGVQPFQLYMMCSAAFPSLSGACIQLYIDMELCPCAAKISSADETGWCRRLRRHLL